MLFMLMLLLLHFQKTQIEFQGSASLERLHWNGSFEDSYTKLNTEGNHYLYVHCKPTGTYITGITVTTMYMLGEQI